MSKRNCRSKNEIMCCFVLTLWVLFAHPGVACGEGVNNDKKFSIEDLLGEPTKNQIYLGMFTYHFDPKSRRTRNWNQDLVGFQYNDIFVGTFRNSFEKRTWTMGMARNYYSQHLSNDWDMTLGGRLGLLYGYRDGQAPLSNYSPVIPMVEAYSQFIYQEHYGMEVMLTTSLSLSFFYQF